MEGRLSVFPVGDDRSRFSAILAEKTRGLSGATATQVQSNGHRFFVIALGTACRTRPTFVPAISGFNCVRIVRNTSERKKLNTHSFKLRNC